ncbi:MAG: AbrB/MazE/SpoVT family DNA-binding domain-containing protein [Synergistaceae bacterium]|jgi:AbrB family looped-hinge helix DNA binding protein|nr:AbrB/MazE/SpoVT family DNA-binding domain-containing protein [Synergistaceae bacterium]
MNTASKITSKGQITLPCYIRDKAGFAVGDTVEFEVRDDSVIIRKPKNLMNFIGCLDGANLPDDLEELLTPEVGRRILERC